MPEAPPAGPEHHPWAGLTLRVGAGLGRRVGRPHRPRPQAGLADPRGSSWAVGRACAQRLPAGPYSRAGASPGSPSCGSGPPGPRPQRKEPLWGQPPPTSPRPPGHTARERAELGPPQTETAGAEQRLSRAETGVWSPGPGGGGAETMQSRQVGRRPRTPRRQLLARCGDPEVIFGKGAPLHWQRRSRPRALVFLCSKHRPPGPPHRGRAAPPSARCGAGLGDGPSRSRRGSGADGHGATSPAVGHRRESSALLGPEKQHGGAHLRLSSDRLRPQSTGR